MQLILRTKAHRRLLRLYRALGKEIRVCCGCVFSAEKSHNEFSFF